VSLLTPVAAFGAALVLFVWAAIGVWVNFDARSREPPSRYLGCVRATIRDRAVLLRVLVALRTPARVAAGTGGKGHRRHRRRRPRRTGRRDLISPPDPTSQLTVWPVAFAGCLPVAYWLVRARLGAREG